MIELIQQRLDSYKASNPVEEEQATKEILQEVALYSLWRAGFFEVAAFQGGTSLRILHKLPRFSEDLDFILKKPDPGFEWSSYLKKLQDGFEEFGLQTEVLDKSRMDQSVKKAVLKDNSISNQLNLSFYRGHPEQKLKIKLEIDVNPPEGSGYEYTYLDFPLDFEVCHQDLASNKEDRLVVLNRVAMSVIDELRGAHPEHVFTYKEHAVQTINNSAWKRARISVGLRQVRVDDLKHTFGRRLRAAGVPMETRKVLLGHKNGDITTHYSAPELEELIEAVNSVCAEKSGKSPALVILKRKAATR